MSDYSELERRAQAAIDAIGTLSRARQEREFNDVCTPQVVKALIAENKRLNADCSSMRGSSGETGMTIDKKKLRAQSEQGFQVSNAPGVILALLDENDFLFKESTRLKEDIQALLENPGDAL